jgi:serine/threonine protein kinase
VCPSFLALFSPSVVPECTFADVFVFHREFSSKDLRTVGNYTLGRLIGKGSFGKVYLATHKLTNGSKARDYPRVDIW